MSATLVIWSAVFEDDLDPVVTRRTTQILSLGTPTGDDAAATVLKWWLEDDVPDTWSGENNWDAQFGDDRAEITVYVMIHEPAEIAGLYQVEAERKITARGYAVDASDADDIAALLSAATAVESA